MAVHNLTLGQNIATAIAAGSAGDTYNFAAGIYYGQTFTPKAGDIYNGNAGGTFLSGACHIATAQWTLSSGTWYKATQGTTDLGGTANFPAATGSEQLYVDNVLYVKQTNTGVAPLAGQWYLDATPAVNIPINPAGHVIEYSITGQISGSPPSSFTMNNITLEKFIGNGVFGGGAVTVTFNNVEVRFCTAAGINVGTCPALYIWGGSYHDCGTNGIAGSPQGGWIIGAHIYNNAVGSGDSGQNSNVKLTAVRDFAIMNCIVSGGPRGIWFDIMCARVTIAYNNVSGTTFDAIHYEISFGGRIFGNTVIGGKTPIAGGDDACIYISNSSDCEVHDNTLTVQAGKLSDSWGAIAIVNVARPDGDNFIVEGNASFTGTISSGTTLTVSAVTGTLNADFALPGMLIYGAGVHPGTRLIAGSGTTWTISKNHPNIGPIAMVAAQETNSMLCEARNNRVYRNKIIYLDAAGPFELYSVQQTIVGGSNNVKDQNTYYTPNGSGTFWEWCTDAQVATTYTWAAYQAAGFEPNSVNIVGLPPALSPIAPVAIATP